MKPTKSTAPTSSVIKKSAFERIVLQGGPARGNLTRSASLAERVAARYLRQSR